MQSPKDPELTYINVLIALSFILLDVVFSLCLGLGIEKSVIVASTRCLVQLSLMVPYSSITKTDSRAWY
jgi:ABC-type iron transport system FetAB permease component